MHLCAANARLAAAISDLAFSLQVVRSLSVHGLDVLQSVPVETRARWAKGAQCASMVTEPAEDPVTIGWTKDLAAEGRPDSICFRCPIRIQRGQGVLALSISRGLLGRRWEEPRAPQGMRPRSRGLSQSDVHTGKRHSSEKGVGAEKLAEALVRLMMMLGRTWPERMLRCGCRDGDAHTNHTTSSSS